MFHITDIHIWETYGGVHGVPSNIESINRQLIEATKERIIDCYGTERKVWEEQVNLKSKLPQYTCIAWLDGQKTSRKSNEDYHGYYLFMVLYTESMEQVLQKVQMLGLEHFDSEAVGYYL